MGALQLKITFIVALVLGMLTGVFFGYHKYLRISKDYDVEFGYSDTGGFSKGYTSHRGFCPSVLDRDFWEGIQPKPERLSDKDFQSSLKNPNIALSVGTIETLFYPEDDRWLIHIERAIQFLTDPDQGDFSSTLGILYTTDAALVANTLQLIGPLLDKNFVKAQREILRRKVVVPFLSDYKKVQMTPLKRGFDACFWLEMDNNWKAVCLTNIVYVAWIVEDDPLVLGKVVNVAQKVINEYLNSFEQDGYFSGGIRYWGYGFSHYILLSEILLQITGGSINMYNHPTVPFAVSFPYQVEISGVNPFKGGTFPLFGDNNNPPLMYKWVDQILKERVGNLGNSTAFEFDPLNSESFIAPYLIISPYRMVSDNKISAYFSPRRALPYSQLAIIRDFDSPLILAVKGGDNDEEHNHNDVGSYSLFYKDPKGVLLLAGDLGVEDYGEGHFEMGKRYTFEGMGSHGHPLPIINNTLQSSGSQARGTIVEEETDIDSGVITFDITACYQDPKIELVKRRISLYSGVLSVKDSFEAYSPVSFETVIPTRLVVNNEGGAITMLGFALSFYFTFQGSMPLTVSNKPSEYFQYAQFLKLSSKKLSNSGFIEYKIKLREAD